MTTRSLGAGWMTLMLLACTACSAPMTSTAPGTDQDPQGGDRVMQQRAGGQSGTDASGGQNVKCPDPGETLIPLDQPAVGGGTGAGLRDGFEGALRTVNQIPLVWTPQFGEWTTLAIEVVKWDSQVLVRGGVPGLCNQLELGVTLHLSTADGLLNEILTGTLIGTSATLRYEMKRLPESDIGQRIASAFDLQPTALKDLTVTMSYMPGYDGMAGQINVDADTDSPDVVSALMELANFDSHLQKFPVTHEHYERPHVFDAECAAAKPTMVAQGMFDSNQDMLDALSGHWLRCSGDSTNVVPYAGLEIDASGTWHYLELQDGALVEQTGFLREGLIDILDTSAMNSGLGSSWRQLNVHYGPFVGAWNPSMEFSSDRQTLRLTVPDEGGTGALSFDDVYQRTQMTVTAPKTTRKDGERAGDAACDEGEAHLRAFSSVDDLRAGLAGRWTVCAGGFRQDATGIAFSADDKTYRHLGADGHVVATGRYKVFDSSGSIPNFQINMSDDDTTDAEVRGHYVMNPYLSMAPVKLWVNDDRRTVLSAMP